MRLKSARPPGSGRKRAHCLRIVEAGEREVGIRGCYASAEWAASAPTYRSMQKRPPIVGGRFCIHDIPAGAQTLGGIVSVTVSPGRIVSDSLIGAAFEPICSIMKRTEFAGLMM